MVTRVRKARNKPGPESQKDTPESRFREKELAQEEASTMIAAGATRKQVADRVGRSKSTIDDWMGTVSFQALVASKQIASVNTNAVNEKSLAVLEMCLDILKDYLKSIKKTKSNANLERTLTILRYVSMKLPMTGTRKIESEAPTASFEEGGTVVEFVKSKRGKK